MTEERKCPHADIRHCPLYEAMHIAGATSCDDGHLEGWQGCAVDRGASYAALVGTLMASHPRIVAQNQWDEQLAVRRRQRDRNLRLNGVH